MAIANSTITRIRAVPMTDILEKEGILFKKIGREAVTLCPWHNDTSPSLTVNDDKGLCFCFACGGGNDSIAYIQQKFSLSFVDAIIRIAEKQNLVVEYDDLDPKEALRIAEERKKAYSEIQAQHNRFRYNIKSEVGAQARQWLLARGISPEASRNFELGWSSSGYFSNRVTVPIHDHRGNVVGFTGRKISSENDEQKYKNSSSSEIFNKGNLLFNEHRAMEYARVAGSIIFVEGHFDVISMWQHGIKNVVATQGTAAPAIESIKRVIRHCKRIILCYDGDSGGHTAIEHFVKVAGPLACKGEVTITVARLPEGKDPDDCIRDGIDLHSIIEDAPQWLDWQIDFWLANIDRSDTHNFSKIETAIRELIESIKSPALRQYYIDKAAKVMSQDIKSAARLARSWNKSISSIKQLTNWRTPEPAWVRNQAERRLLRFYIHFNETRQELVPAMQYLELPSHIWLWNRIQELEKTTNLFTPQMIMAILSVSEPQYMRILRPLVAPTIKLVPERGIMMHAQKILLNKLEING